MVLGSRRYRTKLALVVFRPGDLPFLHERGFARAHAQSITFVNLHRESLKLSEMPKLGDDVGYLRTQHHAQVAEWCKNLVADLWRNT